jgi:hypothetical protein
MRHQKQHAEIKRIGGLCRGCWRVWITVQGKRHVKAVADIIDVPTADEAAAIVMNTWTKDDWDPEAFAYRDQAGNWWYYRLRDTDEIVLERVEATHSC